MNDGAGLDSSSDDQVQEVRSTGRLSDMLRKSSHIKSVEKLCSTSGPADDLWCRSRLPSSVRHPADVRNVEVSGGHDGFRGLRLNGGGGGGGGGGE